MLDPPGSNWLHALAVFGSGGLVHSGGLRRGQQRSFLFNELIWVNEGVRDYA